jgi:hypothetical protein
VSIFNGIYIQEERTRQSGADDAMVLTAAKARYERKMEHKFKWDHWWQAVRHQPKWRAANRDGDYSKRSKIGETGEYTSGGGSQDESPPRPIGRDRAKAAARQARQAKGKGKATSSASLDSTGVTTPMENMTFLHQSLTVAKLWKQYNKMLDRPRSEMDEDERREHAENLKMIKDRIKMLEGRVQPQPETQEDEENEDEED